jgi:hypothetical protein
VVGVADALATGERLPDEYEISLIAPVPAEPSPNAA